MQIKLFLFFSFWCCNVYAQQKNSFSIFYGPLLQSPFEYSENDFTKDYFIPAFTTNEEKGLQFQHKLKSRFSMGFKLAYGTVNHGFQIKAQTLGNNIRYLKGSYKVGNYVSFSSNGSFSPFKKDINFQLQFGIGGRYFLMQNFENNIVIAEPSRGVVLKQLIPAKGTYVMPREYSSKLQSFIEVGLNYTINVLKNRIFVTVNPFGQLSLSNAYNGVYIAYRGGDIKLGDVRSKMHQLGCITMIGIRF